MNLPKGTNETKDVLSLIWKHIRFGNAITDAMHGVSIKELQMIPALMNMHPANVLLAGDDIRITSDVMITKEAAIALNGYINDPRQFDEAEQQA